MVGRLPRWVGADCVRLAVEEVWQWLKNHACCNMELESSSRQIFDRVLQAVAEFHQQPPERPAVAADQLRQVLHLENEVVEGLLASLGADGPLVGRKERIALAEHWVTFTQQGGEDLEKVACAHRVTSIGCAFYSGRKEAITIKRRKRRAACSRSTPRRHSGCRTG